jgi:hypothetical protein
VWRWQKLYTYVLKNILNENNGARFFFVWQRNARVSEMKHVNSFFLFINRVFYCFAKIDVNHKSLRKNILIITIIMTTGRKLGYFYCFFCILKFCRWILSLKFCIIKKFLVSLRLKNDMASLKRLIGQQKSIGCYKTNWLT